MKNNYEIVDVDESSKSSYCMCFDDWSDDIKDAGDNKECWYEKMKDRGLGVKLVKDTDGTLCGHVQYVPAEYAPMTGTGYYFIYCVWVHGHKQGIGDRRGAGMGTALLKAAEEDIRSRGAAGVAAWGITMPFWMKASWYKKHGYRIVQKDGMRCLMWKPFTDDAVPPSWYKQEKDPEICSGKKLLVTSFVNGICPVMNLAYERAKEVCDEFADQVEFNEVRTDEPAVMKEWGISDMLFIGKKQVELGPPVSKQKIRKVIRKQLKTAKC